MYLRDPHENSSVVLSYVEVEVLVFNSKVTSFWKLSTEPSILSAKLFKLKRKDATLIETNFKIASSILILVNRSKNSINETQVMEKRILYFGIKEQLVVMLQNVNDVNKRAHQL